MKERFWRRDAALAESDDEGEEGEEGDGEGGAADEGDGMVEYSDEGEGGDADLRRPWELGRLSQGQIDAMLSSESQRLLRAQKGQLPCTNEKSIALGDVLFTEMETATESPRILSVTRGCVRALDDAPQSSSIYCSI